RVARRSALHRLGPLQDTVPRGAASAGPTSMGGVYLAPPYVLQGGRGYVVGWSSVETRPALFVLKLYCNLFDTKSARIFVEVNIWQLYSATGEGPPEGRVSWSRYSSMVGLCNRYIFSRAAV